MYYHISQLEALNAVVAVKTFLNDVSTPYNVVVHTDNSGSVYAVNSGRTRDPVFSACSREISLVSAQKQSNISLVHVPGTSLSFVDALSRQGFDRKASLKSQYTISDLRLKMVNPIPIQYTLSPI